MSSNAEHGSELWPPSFQDLPLDAQIHVGTQLGKQSSFLRSRPFIHSAANLDKIIDRLNKDDKDEFGWSLSFDSTFIAQLAINGFLPMAGQCFADLICLLPKLHKQRCLMLNLRDDIKVSRGTLKQSRHYEVSMDQAFDGVIAAIQVTRPTLYNLSHVFILMIICPLCGLETGSTWRSLLVLRPIDQCLSGNSLP